MSNRGYGRARMFFGGLLLFAATIAWATSVMMSPHGSATAEGPEHVRNVVVIFVRNSAIGTLVLCTLSSWLLFPAARPRRPLRDYAIAALIVVMVVSSLYQLLWLRSVVVQ